MKKAPHRPAAFPRLLRRGSPRAALAASIALLWLSPEPLHAAITGWNQTTTGNYDYNTTGNWVGGIINGLWDSSLLLTANENVTFAADTVLTTGLNFSYDGSFNETLLGSGANRTITLGGDILVNTVSTTRVITLGSASAGANLNVDLGGVTRTFTVGTSRTLGFVNVISNGSLITSGGTLNFSGANTYSGTTTINTGTFSLNGAAGSSANSDFTLNGNTTNTSTLAFNSGTNGVTGTTRAKSVALNGAGISTGVALTVTGNSTVNSIDAITNALTTPGGFATVTVTPNAARNARLTAGSFSRSAGSTVLFRGTNLGVNTIASQTAGAANIQLGGTVALTGSGGAAGQTTVSIIRGAYGDIAAGGNGAGLVTYDSTNGVRLLDTSTEYTAAIGNGQTPLDNTRYVRASGDASQDINLAAATTTINSLSFRITGAGTNSGVTISGDPGTTLKLSSGVIFANQSVTTAAASDAMTVSVPTLDLNGVEGVFIALTNGVSNGNTNAPLQINSSISNDGGNGLTIGGTGEVIFGGSTAHTYTGITTINSGILRLNKSVLNIGIPGDLVINGGALLKSSNAVPDSASVTLNGGTFWFDNTTSSGNNNHAETINNFTMNAGSVGNHGLNASFTINGNATLNGSLLAMNQGGDVTVLGTTTLSGGLLVAKESSSNAAFNGLTNLNQLVITNPASGAYTAITITSHATNFGAKLILAGDVTFNGNATNSNAVLIASSDISLANQGIIALNDTRTLAIGDGASATDLSISPVLTDNGATVGGLTKTGAGTLALSGNNTYTGPTKVTGGSLMISGSLGGSTAVAVNSGGTLLLAGSAGDHLNNNAVITLGTAGNAPNSGGSFQTGGLSETVGALTLSSNSTIDFGSGASILTFAFNTSTFASGTILTIDNWSGSLGGGGTDQLIFGQDMNSYLGQISFTNFGAGAMEIPLSGGRYEIVPVPEPDATGLLCVTALLGMIGYRERRRLNRTVPHK